MEYQDATRMIVFKNTRLAELWSDDAQRKMDWQDIRDSREVYDLPEGIDVPEPVLLLTCGVDTQDTRLEYTIYGWARGRQSWAIEHGVIDGDTLTDAPWTELTRRVFDREFTHRLGRMKVSQILTDAGGHRTTEVFRWTRGKSPRVFPIRGQGGKGLAVIKDRNFNNQSHQQQIIVGVDSVKIDGVIRLSVEDPTHPGYVHYPKNRDGSPARGFNDEFFRQLCSERCVFKYLRGQPKEEWVIEIGQRNEAWDCFVYATAALEQYAGFQNPSELLEKLTIDRDASQSPDRSPTITGGPGHSQAMPKSTWKPRWKQ
jgi:phage terminase large subunit GpA-like protein